MITAKSQKQHILDNMAKVAKRTAQKSIKPSPRKRHLSNLQPVINRTQVNISHSDS